MNITTLIVIISFFSLFISLFTLIYTYLNNKKIQENYTIFNDITKEFVVKNKIENDVKKISQESSIKANDSNVKRKQELNNTQIEVIKLADKAEITARDVMQKFNITREHASRLLSNLASQGYLKKVNDSKPYKYTIDGKGKEYLSD